MFLVRYSASLEESVGHVIDSRGIGILDICYCPCFRRDDNIVDYCSFSRSALLRADFAFVANVNPCSLYYNLSSYDFIFDLPKLTDTIGPWIYRSKGKTIWQRDIL